MGNNKDQKQNPPPVKGESNDSNFNMNRENRQS
jgi:hypothetical protein